MRIAYLTEWPPYGETGVLRKLIGQVQTWRGLGCEAEIFSLTPTRDEEPALGFSDYGTVVGALRQDSLDRYPFARLGYVNKILSVSLMRKALRRFRPDVIYYRQNGPWYPGLGGLLALAPSVMEINTDEAAEGRHWGAVFDAFYAANQRRVLSGVSAFVAVTEEIARKYRDMGKPVSVVGNSFWSDEAPPAPPSGNDKPAFVFVGSPGMDWHGADKVLRLAASLPASRFHVVGVGPQDFRGAAIPPNVEAHGHKTGPELTEIYRKSDIGIGTLALHRKDMEEACPLKTREYLMYRLPVIVGYTETEVPLRSAPYILQIGNDEENVVRNLDQIARFADQWAGRRVTDDLSFLSRRSKEKERLEFLSGLI